MMTTLLIDNSNGRTKLQLAEGVNPISDVHIIRTAEVCAETLREAFVGRTFDRVALCSVVPTCAALIEAYYKPIAPCVRIGVHASLPVNFSDYAGRDTLGADRVADAVAAASLFPGQALAVADVGTAMTLDVVLPARGNSRARFLGGAIAPGLGSMLNLLAAGTAQLPEVPRRRPVHAVGRTTQEAMQSGCVLGYVGMVLRLLESMERECSCPLKLILTGGDAPILLPEMPEGTECLPRLTLQGIALCADAVMHHVEKC